jgi:hypothetical protein
MIFVRNLFLDKGGGRYSLGFVGGKDSPKGGGRAVAVSDFFFFFFFFFLKGFVLVVCYYVLFYGDFTRDIRRFLLGLAVLSLELTRGGRNQCA